MNLVHRLASNEMSELEKHIPAQIDYVLPVVSRAISPVSWPCENIELMTG